MNIKQRVLPVAFAVLVASALVPSAASAVTAPASDPFYAQPANIAQYPHGTILRERQVTLSGPTQVAGAAAYQLMYATTNTTGQPVAAVMTVIVPSAPAPGPRRLASYQTFYDSLTLNCAPSYTLQGGNNGGGTNNPIEQTMMSEELEQGWDVVTSDYEGLDSEWAVGPMLGYATLDSITAVEHFAPAGLEGSETEVTLSGTPGARRHRRGRRRSRRSTARTSTSSASPRVATFPISSTPPTTSTTRSGTGPRSACSRASAAPCRRTSI
jgi:Secretory lipase